MAGRTKTQTGLMPCGAMGNRGMYGATSFKKRLHGLSINLIAAAAAAAAADDDDDDDGDGDDVSRDAAHGCWL